MSENLIGRSQSDQTAEERILWLAQIHAETTGTTLTEALTALAKAATDPIRSHNGGEDNQP